MLLFELEVSLVPRPFGERPGIDCNSHARNLHINCYSLMHKFTYNDISGALPGVGSFYAQTSLDHCIRSSMHVTKFNSQLLHLRERFDRIPLMCRSLKITKKPGKFFCH